MFRQLPVILFMLCAVSGFIRADESSAFAGQLELPVRNLVQTSCLDCHNSMERSGGLDLNSVIAQGVEQNREVWENVVRKLSSRQMPPGHAPRPDESTYDLALKSLESSLDRIAAERLWPGRTGTFRRLTRTEYQNAVRDLLSLEIDATTLLPKDESSQGFDNITVADLSPSLLNRYVSAAQKISRLAVGGAGRGPGGDTIRVRPDITQEDHVAGLPIGTRGGALIRYTFPQDGEYEITVRLARDRNEHVEGLRGQHELEVLIDRRRAGLFMVKPPADRNDHSGVDSHLSARVRVQAGAHQLGVTFLKTSGSLLETVRQPYQAHFNMHRHPRISPAVYQVSITGPYDATGPGDTRSRRRVFICHPESRDEEEACAKKIMAAVMRRAWRRPIDEEDLLQPLEFFRQGRVDGDFDLGIESALAFVLVSPQFLFRIERDPPNTPAGKPYHVTDVSLASRLSFFLWSSIPDDELMGLADSGKLSQPDVLEQQVRRMLLDERSQSLVTNFVGQWLYLRNLDSVSPDMRRFPDFDDNLRQAMRTETELFFDSIMREDRSVLDLLQADHTYLNERLARHYGIPHVHGSRFRRVALGTDSHRGGLLRQASILTVTSYATRTSPVIRGHWILKNLLGNPPPPPPDDVPALKDNTVLSTLSVRQRLAQHRADPNCAGCHDLMDPVGFALENYDAIGRWRDLEEGLAVDASGGLPDGSKFSGVEGLEQGLLQRPELFAGTLTEKLLTYALGRGLDYHDASAVRRIVKDARAEGFRFSSLIIGIVNSTPFQMRAAE
jgi:hypothetical protein